MLYFQSVADRRTSHPGYKTVILLNKDDNIHK